MVFIPCWLGTVTPTYLENPSVKKRKIKAELQYMRGKGQVLLIVEALHNVVIHVHKIAGETTAPTCSTTDRLHRQLLCHKEQLLLEAGNNPYAISQPRKRPV